METVSVQTESIELSATKRDVSVQFTYLIPSNDTLKGVCIGSDKLFLIQGDSPQILNWEKYGLRITVSQGTLSPTDTCEVSIAALAGGHFQLPKESELISAVYNISVSKPLLKPVKLEIQHCADIVTQNHTSCLCFAIASVNIELPYNFQLEEGGQFHSCDQYGRFVFLSSLYDVLLRTISRDCWDIQ